MSGSNRCVINRYYICKGVKGMKKGRGRILSILLAVVLALTSMSTLALAKEDTMGGLADKLYSGAGSEENNKTERSEEAGMAVDDTEPAAPENGTTDGTEGTGSSEEGGVDADSDTGNETDSDDETEGGTDTDVDADTGSGTDTKGGIENDADAPAITFLAGWSWVDEEGYLQETDGVWGLGIPGASEASPVTQETLLAMLPMKISGTTADGEEVTVDIAWDLSAIPEGGIWEGNYVFTASLPDGYEMADGVTGMSVKVELGEVKTYVSEWNLANSRVQDAVSPRGTTIDVFDYWIDKYRNSLGQEIGEVAQDAPDSTGAENGRLSNGINNGHLLLFGKGLNNSGIAAANGGTAQGGARYNNGGSWNGWAGKGSGPVNGIVASVLGRDGFPRLALNLDSQSSGLENNWKVNGGSFNNYPVAKRSESLAYLFDRSEHAGKNAYTNVGKLLRIDSEGYYYYDSTKNFASLKDGMTQTEYKNGTDGADFVLYNTKAVFPAGNSPGGQFFPFDGGSEVFRDNGSGITADTRIKSDHTGINHYFGLHMQTRFVQQYGGHTNIDEEDEVTYEFSGDDDVWIFIDGVLVADLGGVHDAVSVDINFATGRIEISSASTNSQKFRTYSSTLREKYRAAGKEGSVAWSREKGKRNTFADDTYHTLDFFYLERGNVDSNMNLKYNLVSVPESEIIKVDQVGEKVAGAGFKLYATDRDYKVDAQAVELASGVTDADGEFTLIDKEGYILSLNQLYEKGYRHFVLRETDVPSGYRSSGDMYLYFPEGTKEAVLLSDNEWESGTYASAKVTAKSSASITLTDGGKKNLMPVSSGGDGGLMFGVVLQFQGGENDDLSDWDNWLPVYGDPLGGWTVSEDGGIAGAIAAARENSYVFTIDSSGSFKTEIENLPGDMLSYYYMLSNPTASNVKYTVAYYYTSADTLDGATVRNTKLVDSGGFEREFAASLYVPNVMNRLYVQKVDDAGVPVNGAQFDLYKEGTDGISDDGAGNVTISDTAKAYASITTGDITEPFKASGTGVFLENSGLPKGVYYLKEVSAPGGYKRNETVTKIIVDDTGVYADAGKQDDGVIVRRSVGMLVKSMIQFAVDDGVDGTLHDIRTELFTSGSYASGQGSSAAWTAAGKTSHLQYDKDAVLEYKPITLDGIEQPLTLETDTGWSRLKIGQCMEHDDNISSPKQDLGDTDLTNLFSGVVTVQVENERVGGLTISKEISDETGLAGSETQFEFTVTCADAIDGTYSADRYTEGSVEPSVENVQFKAGTASVKLKGGESIYIHNLPNNMEFTVTETVAEGYDTSVSTDGTDFSAGNSGTVTVTHTGNALVAFHNTYNPKSSFSFTKITREGDGLKGAVFALYRLECQDENHHDHTADADQIKADEDGSIDGSYANADCWELTGGTVTSGSDGTVTFADVPISGTYRLVEVKTPGGYAAVGGQWIVTYDAKNKEFTVPAGGSIGNPPAFHKKDRTIINYQPGELPFAGNIGIKLFLIIGGALMLLGAAGGTVWYFRCRRTAQK